jgi:hypothetical protein
MLEYDLYNPLPSAPAKESAGTSLKIEQVEGPAAHRTLSGRSVNK